MTRKTCTLTHTESIEKNWSIFPCVWPPFLHSSLSRTATILHWIIDVISGQSFPTHHLIKLERKTAWSFLYKNGMGNKVVVCTCQRTWSKQGLDTNSKKHSSFMNPNSIVLSGLVYYPCSSFPVSSMTLSSQLGLQCRSCGRKISFCITLLPVSFKFT